MANKGGPKGKYTIHSAHTKLPKFSPGMGFVSIDPGYNNFAIRIEKRHRRHKHSVPGQVEMLALSKHIIEYNRSKSDLGSVSNYIFNIIEVLEIYQEYYVQCSIVLIEDQMYVNGAMAGLKEHIINYFVYCHPKLCVLTISAKLKTNMLTLKKGTSKSEIQRREVTYAFELCEKREDTTSLEILLEYNGSKVATDKVHDLCVTVNQLDEFCRTVGY